MKYTQSYRRPGARRGFTLVEILVVLAIIAILAGILLPVMNGVKERANQTSCATNLQQIQLAVKMYYADEREYPNSLAQLLPTSANLNNTTSAPNVNAQPCTADTCPNARGTGDLKGIGNLICPSADTPTDNKPWSSYGDVSTGLDATYDPADLTKDPDGTKMARYVWNYWGYNNRGTAYMTDDAAYLEPFKNNSRFLLPGAAPGNVASVDTAKLPRLANRFAPANTIITHCVYHRIPTGNSLANPAELYTTPANDTGARDIVLRLDGSAKLYDVTAFQGASPDQSQWIFQNFQ